MSFNPLQEKGIPIDKQVRDWSSINSKPYDKSSVHPYTRTRVILMNGIEVDAAIFGHQFHRHCHDQDLRRKLAMSRRVEQQQQKAVNWLVPANETTLEVTVGYEQVAVDLTSFLARTEPEPYVKAALDFALLEDFDHLYRYANLMDMTEHTKAESIVGELTEVMPGRPTVLEHQHPFDSVRRPTMVAPDNMLSLLHIATIVAAEQQTMNFYMNVGDRADSELARGLYAEIAQIEEQHVTHYGSLMDPTATWAQRLVLHEYNECYLYYSCTQTEVDQRIRAIWQEHLEQEIEHLHIACDLLEQQDGIDREQFLPAQMPQIMTFQSNKDYVREVLGSQIDLTADLEEYVPVGDLREDHRYHRYQRMVNAGPYVPSQRVIEEHVQRFGEDYRFESDGPHPVERLRVREHAVV